MNHLPSSIIFFLLLAVSVSCGRRNDNLDCARRLMDSMPDSALTILQSVDTSTLSSPSDRAAYSLLLSRALDKNYMDLTSDSIARIAYDYYCIEGHGTDDERMEAAYSMAIICSNGGNDLEGLRYAKEAELYGESSKDFLTRGLIYRLQSDMASALKMHSLALYCSDKAIDFFKKGGYQQYVDYEQCARGLISHNLGRYSTAIHILDSLKAVVTDITLAFYAQKTIAASLFALKAYPEAKSVILSLYKNSELRDFETNAFLSCIYFNENNVRAGQNYLDSAMLLYDASPDGRIAISNILESKYRIEGNTDSLVDVLTERCVLKDSIYSHFFDREREFMSWFLLNQNEKSLLQKISDSHRLVFVIVIISILIISGGLYILYKYRSKISLMKARCEDLDEKVAKSENEIHKLLSQNEEYHSLLINMKETEKNILRFIQENFTGKIIKMVKMPGLEKISERNRIFEELEIFLNNTRDGLMFKFDNLFPDIKPLDRMMFIAICIGLPTDLITQTFDISKDVFNNRKSRMKKKIIEKTGQNDFKFYEDTL